MTAERRTALLDSAITVLGDQGVRAVTHRAVDSAAGLPQGSASNHFRSRDALFDAMVVRIAERELAVWEQLARSADPRTGDELADLLAAYVSLTTSDHRTLVLARYAILVQAGSHPELRRQLVQTGAGVNTRFELWLRTAGFDDIVLAANLIMNYCTGLQLHQLAMPDPDFDPVPRLRVLVSALLHAAAPATSVNGGHRGQ